MYSLFVVEQEESLAPNLTRVDIFNGTQPTSAAFPIEKVSAVGGIDALLYPRRVVAFGCERILCRVCLGEIVARYVLIL